jgi:hypothetical protein
MSVLATLCGSNFAAEGVCHELKSIADSQHRQAKLEYSRVGRRSVAVIHGRRPAGKNDPDRRIFLNVFNLGIAGKNRGKNVLLADAASDQVRILRPEVEYND